MAAIVHMEIHFAPPFSISVSKVHCPTMYFQRCGGNTCKTQEVSNPFSLFLTCENRDWTYTSDGLIHPLDRSLSCFCWFSLILPIQLSFFICWTLYLKTLFAEIIWDLGWYYLLPERIFIWSCQVPEGKRIPYSRFKFWGFPLPTTKEVRGQTL